MQTLLALSVAMLAGLMMSRLTKIWNLPAVTAYLVAGVLIGPCVIGALGIPGLGFSSFEQLENIKIISKVALGFIAFSIGNEFRLAALKQTGRQALVIGIFQAVGKGKESLIFAIMRKVLLEIPALYILNKLFPLYGLDSRNAPCFRKRSVLFLLLKKDNEPLSKIPVKNPKKFQSYFVTTRSQY